ncbi:hypothetical protein [Streptomyces sp. SID8499]|uniref:hypothetical protein n=1 Tax=Streptomyces sp. SID8499 TaxID=2706106 RepID=UPI0013C90DCC|nr:hypothetical protein [Streptomyces sp. SID8499]NED36710.1 hypothetical protein [Streptomyces sp. SID8499]
MHVFRVAHSVSKRHGESYYAGPYSRWVEPALPEGTEKYLINPMGIDHSDFDEHRSPNECPTLRGIRPWEVCGLVSREALNKWFQGWRGLLARYGYRVYVFDVPKEYVRVGENGQCVFEISAATLVRTEEVTA